MKKKRVSQDDASKIVLVGDVSVGKSCLMARFIRGEFMDNYKATLGVEFGSKVLTLPNIEKSQIKIILWDTAGQEKYRSVVRNFYRNSAAVLLVYSLLSRQSLENLKAWLHDAKQECPKAAQYFLVGTHLDERENRKVMREDADGWAQSNDINLSFEVSSKTGQNIDSMMEMVALRILQKKNSILDGIESEKMQKEHPELSERSARGSELNSRKCCK